MSSHQTIGSSQGTCRLGRIEFGGPVSPVQCGSASMQKHRQRIWRCRGTALQQARGAQHTGQRSGSGVHHTRILSQSPGSRRGWPGRESSELRMCNSAGTAARFAGRQSRSPARSLGRASAGAGGDLGCRGQLRAAAARVILHLPRTCRSHYNCRCHILHSRNHGRPRTCVSVAQEPVNTSDLPATQHHRVERTTLAAVLSLEVRTDDFV